MAERIVDAFLAVHESAARYYDRHPDHREELVAEIASQIAAVRR